MLILVLEFPLFDGYFVSYFLDGLCILPPYYCLGLGIFISILFGGLDYSIRSKLHPETLIWTSYLVSNNDVNITLTLCSI